MDPREDVTWFVGAERVRGWLRLPEGDGTQGGKAPCFVLCPGYAAVRYAAFYQLYVDRLAAAGYATLLLDYRGWGDSEGERGVIDPPAQVDDVLGALTYLRQRPEIEAGRLGLLGFSFGGGVAVAAAARDRRVRVAVSLLGVGDGREWLHRCRREYEWHAFLADLESDRNRRTLTGVGRMVQASMDISIPTPDRAENGPALFGAVPAEKLPAATPLWSAERILAFRPVDDVARAGHAALLFVAVDGDTVAPADQTAAMHARAVGASRLRVLHGESHYRAFVDEIDTVFGDIRAWAAEHMA